MKRARSSTFRSCALGEASMLYACQLGQRTGIVTINPRFIPWFHHQIGKYGLEKRVTGVHAMTFEPGQILKAYEFGRAGRRCGASCLPNRHGRLSRPVATC